MKTEESMQPATPAPGGHAVGNPAERGVEALREDAMMSHLLEALPIHPLEQKKLSTGPA